MRPLQRFQMPATRITSERAKRAAAPLDAAARARIAVVVPASSDVDSSGSEHEAAALSSLVNEYLFEADPTTAAPVTADQDYSGSEDEGDKNNSFSAAAANVANEIKGIVDTACKSDKMCRRLSADVTEAVKGLDDLRPNRSAFRRAVMSRLRDISHDAGLCKLRWDKTSRMAAGSYEYVDVVVAVSGAEADTRRFIVDVGFAAEFEVARPTPEFEAVRAALPEVLVAPADDARRVVRAASAAARRSLKSRGFSVPPWRKRRFVTAKWFGPYRRTVNRVPEPAGAAAGLAAASGGVATAYCRTIVGFAPLPATATTSSGIRF
ncbi:hypothetical protein PR202_gb29329 [Eleusine coracana subsp. coracana]|uniref:Uncharacterized protein n=1 Tax=Eleusine coracana subsp. coracana TaxID=191504 RepID=A0AAV5FYN9_ELECO|nr:hypothetical protein QOZ80_9BG0706360 [Eleusine coracana subsp. coracana]GJN40151.1 hypothetical protein PR202_gb29329 [Eleusine coracana subsp. coracana]